MKLPGQTVVPKIPSFSERLVAATIVSWLANVKNFIVRIRCPSCLEVALLYCTLA